VATLKFPSEASTCEECIYYSKLLKYCLKYKVPVEDPRSPPCKPKGYFMYTRPDENTLVGELCLPDVGVLSKVIPLKPKVRVGEILDALEKVGCKPKESKRVKDYVTIYLTCPCAVRASIKCTEEACVYRIMGKGK